MKDKKNELNADVESRHAKSILFFSCQKPSNKSNKFAVQPLAL